MDMNSFQQGCGADGLKPKCCTPAYGAADVACHDPMDLAMGGSHLASTVAGKEVSARDAVADAGITLADKAHIFKRCYGCGKYCDNCQ